MMRFVKSIYLIIAVLALPLIATAQVNSGSDGRDGVFNPTQDVTIDMADHPDGIYQYTSVNIPSGVTVTFKPNAQNKPVVWLVQGNCTISGTISVTGNSREAGGPGGWAGGNIGGGGVAGGNGRGPGGGPGSDGSRIPGHASFATLGGIIQASWIQQLSPGELYGTDFCLPLIGGSGGGGGTNGGGGGGGGAFLVATSGTLDLRGSILVRGQDGSWVGGAGSGGAVRVVATKMIGSGSIDARGGAHITGNQASDAGNGRVRLDVLDNQFAGWLGGSYSRGFQPIIIPPASAAISLNIYSVAGIIVPANPAGQLVTPDVIVPGNQQNPISILVRCANIPLNSEIIVDVKPVNGPAVRAVGLNTSGTQSSSTASIQINIPRGGGTIQAKAVSGLTIASTSGANERLQSLVDTGWTADGERFAQVEVTAILGRTSQIVLLTDSGKRYPLPIP